MTREEKIALLVDELEDIRRNNFDANTEEDKTLKEVVRVIKTLKQESKTGHWIDTHDKEEWWGEEFICSECDYRMIGDSNFCPNCGVDMRSDVE